MEGNSTGIPFERIQENEERILRERKASSEPTVGIALSGGGIRSASFNLGILQVLERAGILPLADYLSTVSGGGYTGAHFLAQRFQGRKLSTGKDDPSLQHLRRFSNYLTPSMGLFSKDTWTLVMIWLRNTALLQAFLICVFTCVLLLPRFHGWALWTFGLADADNSPWLTTGGVISVYVLEAIMLFICHGLIVSWQSFEGGTEKAKGEYAKPTALVLGSILGSALLTPSLYVSIGKAASEQSLAILFALTMATTAFPLALFSLGYARGFKRSQFWAALTGVAILALNPALWVNLTSTPPESLWNFALPPAILRMVIFAFAPFWLCHIEEKEKRKDLGRSALAAVVCGAVAFGVIHLAYATLSDSVLHMKAHPAAGPVSEFFWNYTLLAAPGVMVAIAVCLTVMIGIVGRAMPDLVREAWSRLAAMLLLTSGMILAVGAIGIYAPFGMLRGWYALSDYVAGAGGLAAAAFGALSLFSATGSGTSGKKEDMEKAGPMEKAKALLASFAPGLFVALLVFTVSLGAHLLLVQAAPEPADHWKLLGDSITGDGWAWKLFAACLGVALLLGWRVDVNEFSLNRFYRNRLVRCFLGAARAGRRSPNSLTGFDFDDDLQMCQIREFLEKREGLAAETPIPIVNTALNAVGGEDAVLSERRAHSLFFTPFHVFSNRTQGMDASKVSTGRLEDDVSLGSLISISGAAANPNSGFHSSPPIAFLLTFFNVRLGWWLRNVNADATWFGKTFSLAHSFSELFGTAKDNDAYVNISDGGHFENLGLYELIRRQCGLIVVGDGEQDGTFSFGALGMAVRRCRVDFEAEIDIRVDDIRPPQPLANSRHHFVTGTIRYRGGKTGVLLYFKSSFTGREAYDVEQYKLENPQFPHQPTSDQFFSESQFESYRQVGMHAASEFLAEVKPKYANRTELRDSIRDFKRAPQVKAAAATGL